MTVDCVRACALCCRRFRAAMTEKHTAHTRACTIHMAPNHEMCACCSSTSAKSVPTDLRTASRIDTFPQRVTKNAAREAACGQRAASLCLLYILYYLALKQNITKKQTHTHEPRFMFGFVYIRKCIIRLSKQISSKKVLDLTAISGYFSRILEDILFAF